MNSVQQAAFDLQLDELKEHSAEGLSGTLLAACSSHNPDSKMQVRVIRYLLKSGVCVNETDKNGVTPLHRAVRFRSLEAVRELITHGAEVNAVDKKSRSTPLHRAVTNTGAPATAGKTGEAVLIAEMLLSNGADSEIKNKNGKKPFDYVKDADMERLFREHGAAV